METVYIGSDHGGFEMKKMLIGFMKSEGYKVVDVGPFAYDKGDDYPDYAEKVCNEVIANKGRGILICRTGHGMNIAANKVAGIYASICLSEESAQRSKVDENINVLCLAGDFISSDDAEKIVKKWLDTPLVEEERHSRRQKKFKDIENRNLNPRHQLQHK